MQTIVLSKTDMSIILDFTNMSQVHCTCQRDAGEHACMSDCRPQTTTMMIPDTRGVMGEPTAVQLNSKEALSRRHPAAGAAAAHGGTKVLVDKGFHSLLLPIRPTYGILGAFEKVCLTKYNQSSKSRKL